MDIIYKIIIIIIISNMVFTDTHSNEST